MISLSYIIPTIGRTTLARAVDGILDELQPCDQLFVVGDGPLPQARETMAARQRQNVFYLEHGPTHNWGTEQIDYATRLARGDYLCYLGDDDEIEPGAMLRIRLAVSNSNLMPHIFAMWHTDRILKRGIKHCECSGQQFVIPNVPSRLAPYSHPENQHTASDAAFLARSIKLWGGQYEFHDEVIARLERQNEGRFF